mgnify:CR=1 FL=1
MSFVNMRLLVLLFVPEIKGAVLEVTAGGDVTDPTYRFSDASGSAVATASTPVLRMALSLSRESRD